MKHFQPPNAIFLAGLVLAVCLWACRQADAQAAVPYVWRNVEIVGGGFVPGIVFSPKQPDLIYARTDIGGAYRWNPAAKRWMPLTDWVSQAESNLLGVESIGVDPTDARRVYLAVGTYTQSWAGNGAILRSVDQGRTWQRTNMPFKMGGNEEGRSVGERLAVDPHKNSVLFFGSRKDGLWRCADFGATWNKVAGFPANSSANGVGIGFVVFDPRGASAGSPTQSLYVGVAAPGVGLYRSRDGGATWEAVPGQPTGLLPHHGVLDVQGVLYLTYGNAPGPNGMTGGAVWKCDTQSGVWTDITPVNPGTAGEGQFGYAGLALDAAHPGTVMAATMDKWATGDDIYRTTDGGAHWTALKPKAVRDSSAAPFLNWNAASAPLGHWIGTLEIDPFHPGHALYGTGATIWGSDDVTAADTGAATHWTVRAQGLEETAVNDLLSPPAGAHLLSGLGDIGGFRHDDLTVSPRAGLWKNPIMNTTTGLDFAGNAPALAARVGHGEPGKCGAWSRDGAATWTPFAAEPAGSRGGGSVAVSADGSVLVWTPDNGLPAFSRDHGDIWTVCAGLPPKARLVADRVNPNKFYACDAAGRVYASADGGEKFSVTAAQLPRGNGRLRAVPGREGDLWLTAGEGGLFHSTNGGIGFTKIEGAERADALGFGKAAPGQTYPALYATGTINGVAGVFRSDDAGMIWARINDDQHQYGWIGQTITGDPRFYGRVYLGTNGRGILYADPAPLVRRH